MNITETKEGSIIEVFVKPKSREFKIAVEADEIVAYCTEQPVQGKVNKELIKELSRLLKKRVELVSGFASKQKCLLIRNMSQNEAEAVLFRRIAQP
jgi:uncharacterized protein (TIGR00251 family)